jgi:sporulation protein YlmC with PRC-barrel domain
VREIQLYQLLGKKVVDANGEYTGRLEEIEAERGDEVCLINNYLVEHRGILDRIMTWAIAQPVQHVIPIREKSKPYRVPWDQLDISDPDHPRITVPQSELRRVRGVS